MVTLGPFAIDASLTGPGGRVVAALRLESPGAATSGPPAGPTAPAGPPAAPAPATAATGPQTPATGPQAPATAAGSLRDTMPHSAAVVDWLRGFLGREAADRVIARGRAGRGGAYFAEVGPDGQLREFGSTYDGRRWVMVNGAPAWVDRAGVPIQPAAAGGGGA